MIPAGDIMYYYYRGILAYDGTNYSGWQMQRPGIPTVQLEIEKAVSKLFDTERIPVNGASRTDSGVHARGQVIQFRAKKQIEAHKVYRGCNTFLPHDIRLLSLEDSQRAFHPIFSALGKKYVYRFIYPDDPLRNRYAYVLNKLPDIDLMENALPDFQGEHDFAAFRNMPSKTASKETVCNIKEIYMERHKYGFDITVKGNRFLYNMIRIMMGTLLYMGLGIIPEDSVKKSISTGNRDFTGKTLAPEGLTLEKVYYDSF